MLRYLYSFFSFSGLRSDYLLLNRFLSMPFVLFITFPLDGCTPTQEDNYCYTVDTKITISHHPYLYPEESVDLVIASKSAVFIPERELYTGVVPTQLEAKVVLILKGVEPRLMEPEEITILEMSIIEFLNGQLLSDSRKDDTAPILIIDAKIEYQEIVLSGNTTEDEATLRTGATIPGEYLPPPEVNDFGDIIVETIGEKDDEFVEVLTENAAEKDEEFVEVLTENTAEKDEEFVEVLTENAAENKTYFMAVNYVGALTDRGGGSGGFDIIAFAGYTVAAFAGFAGVLVCISYTRRIHRRKNQACEADELRAAAAMVAKNMHNLNVRQFESERLSKAARCVKEVRSTADVAQTVRSNDRPSSSS